MKKIALVVAVEMAAVEEKYGEPVQRIPLAGREAQVFQRGEHQIYVFHSGAGEIAAAAATQALITRFEPDFILNFGVVGALTKEMGVQKACLVERVVHYDFDTSEFDGCEVGRYMELPDRYIPMDQDLLNKARAVLPELPLVTCASADKFVEGPEAKGRLHQEFNADICEMEAAGIALTCWRNKVPCLALKLVSDGVEGGAEEFTQEFDKASAACLDLLDKLIDEAF